MPHDDSAAWASALRDPETAGSVAATLHALATPSRLRIVAALHAGPVSVGDLAAAVEMEQSAVSHQLRLLRDLRFVVAERQGRHVLYRLFDSHVLELVAQGLAHAEHLDLDLDVGLGDHPQQTHPQQTHAPEEA